MRKHLTDIEVCDDKCARGGGLVRCCHTPYHERELRGPQAAPSERMITVSDIIGRAVEEDKTY